MDFLREVVAGPKKRLKQQGYNLDLTYITPRVIAMAYPATGIQKLYRNPVQSVCQYLALKHKSRYITINLSNRTVDQKLLQNVQSFNWEDHKPPSFQMLFVICQTIAKFLLTQPEGVAVIHCNHGKGRTGTIISCFLLFTGKFQNSGQSMKFYSDQRFNKEGQGVTQPGQIAYIKYFNKILKNPEIKPQVVYVKRVIFNGGHKLNDPYLKLRNISNNEELLSTKKNNSVKVSDSTLKRTWKFDEQAYFAGDYILQIKHDAKMGTNMVGGYHFNTAFIPPNEIITANLDELSPHNLGSSGIFELDFKLQIHFSRIDCKCQINTPITQKCNRCRQKLIDQDLKFTKIAKVLTHRPAFLEKKDQILYGKKTEQGIFAILDKKQQS